MANPTFRVVGQVVDRSTRVGVRGLRVEAWDKDQKYHDLLGVAITDHNGHFLITFDQTYFREFAPEKFPDLFFRIYRGQNLLKSTEDSVIWNAKSATDVTIEISMVAPAQPGKDLISARQAFKAVSFVKRSDFRGLRKEIGDRGGTAFGFVADMVKNTVTKMDVKPLKVGTHKTSDVIGQDPEVARENLRNQQVTVSEIRPYKPELDAKSVADIAAFPMRVKAGQKVNLYEEDGKVRYYSMVKDVPPVDAKTVDAVKIESEVEEVKARLGELDTVKAELADLSKIKEELQTAQREVARKDQQITTLQQELESLRTAQTEMLERLAPDAIARMEQEIKQLQEFKATVEKTPKKTPKSKSAPKKSNTSTSG